jgi:carboxypeptidase Taq
MITMNSTSALERLHELDRAHRNFARISAVLQWDQETYLPSSAVEERSEQLAAIEGVAHERAADAEIGVLLERLGSVSDHPRGDESLPAIERDFLRMLRREYDRAVALPSDLVTAQARDAGLSQAAWVRARRANDFSGFAPHLRTMIAHAKRKAECLGFAERPYDGLLDLYEPGLTEASVAAVFGPLRERLASLVRRIAEKPSPDTTFLSAAYPVEAQDAFGRSVMRELGFESARGRLDLSAHPFTTTLGADDVRITTRYSPTNFVAGLFSTIHETGHALYELGFGPDLRPSLLADGASMGIHESQSRLWENVIGRSLPFWKGRFPALKAAFGAQLSGIDAEAFYRAVNVVRPSLIRVDADEVTYSLHVILRFELERRLFSGALEVDELPEAWRKLMADLLGVEPTGDADGVLQDVHWSIGAFGYFPSYALGNLYGLQFWRALKKDLPDVDTAIEAGRFDRILAWLREKIHSMGRRLDPVDLLASVTGESLDSRPFIEYLETKYGSLYSL